MRSGIEDLAAHPMNTIHPSSQHKVPVALQSKKSQASEASARRHPAGSPPPHKAADHSMPDNVKLEDESTTPLASVMPSRQTWTHAAFSRWVFEPVSPPSSTKEQQASNAAHQLPPPPPQLQHRQPQQSLQSLQPLQPQPQPQQEQQRQTNACGPEVSLAGVCTVRIGQHMFSDTKFYTVLNRPLLPPPSPSRHSAASPPRHSSPSSTSSSASSSSLSPLPLDIAGDRERGPSSSWNKSPQAWSSSNPDHGHGQGTLLVSQPRKDRRPGSSSPPPSPQLQGSRQSRAKPRPAIAIEFKENSGVLWHLPELVSLKCAPSSDREPTKVTATFNYPLLDSPFPSKADSSKGTGPGGGAGGRTNGRQAVPMVIYSVSSSLLEALEAAFKSPRVAHQALAGIKSSQDDSSRKRNGRDHEGVLGHQPAKSNDDAPTKRRLSGEIESHAGTRTKRAKNENENSSKASGSHNTKILSGVMKKNGLSAGPSTTATTSSSTSTASSKRCGYCGCTTTPMWRRGPNGPSTLCNACGVKWKHGKIMQDQTDASSTTPKPTPTSSTKKPLPVTTPSGSGSGSSTNHRASSATPKGHVDPKPEAHENGHGGHPSKPLEKENHSKTEIKKTLPSTSSVQCESVVSKGKTIPKSHEADTIVPVKKRHSSRASNACSIKEYGEIVKGSVKHVVGHQKHALASTTSSSTARKANGHTSHRVEARENSSSLMPSSSSTTTAVASTTRHSSSPTVSSTPSKLRGRYTNGKDGNGCGDGESSEDNENSESSSHRGDACDDDETDSVEMPHIPNYPRTAGTHDSISNNDHDNTSLETISSTLASLSASFPLNFPTISIAFGPDNAYFTYPNCAVVLFESHFRIKLNQGGEKTEIDVWKEGIEGTEFQAVDAGDGESMIVMKALLRQYLTRFDKEFLNPDRHESLIIFRFRERLESGGPQIKPLLEHWLTMDIPPTPMDIA
ncbi:hypothetical protein BGW38_001638 [Lunasporangiospora selenospora]|uniref:GATA-type domain-containing protein n=1 Tax=Lunasporangiospora selenospora TaxID=979761 RepID=A0A9P6FT56_9FUNG|nr:hypothetical protein BGW38_001638 [Lunasporangiospora selenospora]